MRTCLAHLSENQGTASKALLKKFKRNEFETQEGINFGDSDTKYWTTSVIY